MIWHVYPSLLLLFIMQEDQVAALTGENLALKRETEALLVRQKKNRWEVMYILLCACI